MAETQVKGDNILNKGVTYLDIDLSTAPTISSVISTDKVAMLNSTNGNTSAVTMADFEKALATGFVDTQVAYYDSASGWLKTKALGNSATLNLGSTTGTVLEGSATAVNSSLLENHNAAYFQPLLTNPITGTGTSGYIPKWTGTSTQENSGLYTDGTNFGIGTTAPGYNLSFSGDSPRTIGIEQDTTHIGGQSLTVIAGGGNASWNGENGGDLILSGGQGIGTGSSNIYFKTATAGAYDYGIRTPDTKMTILGSGNVGIGYSTGTEITNNKFAVNGSVNATSFSIKGAASGTATIVAPSVAGTPTLTLPTITGTLALTSDIPTNNNQLINGAGFITGYTDTNTTYTFATGTTNGTFNVTPSGGSLQAVSIFGLGSNAYTSTAYATPSDITTAINNLIDTAPGTLNTLNELAAALGDDPNFATTIATSIGGKQANLSGTGLVRSTAGVISYDTNTYITGGTISGVSLGSNLYALIIGTGLSGTSYNGSSAVTIACTITQYTDTLARSAQNTANTTTTGLLTSTDWNTFNSKQAAGSYVTGTPWTGMGYVTGTPWTGMGYLTSAQTIAAGGTTSPTITLSASGGTITFTGSGYTSLLRTGNTINITSDGNMTYPSGSGIPIVGSGSWGTTIANNSSDWNNAYGWGNWASNFGSTTGTILQGRTFGTAANNATGDFEPNLGSPTGYTYYLTTYNGTRGWVLKPTPTKSEIESVLIGTISSHDHAFMSHNLNAHSDVLLYSSTANQVLYYNGTNWVNGAVPSHTHTGTYEPVLGNPGTTGYVLSSTTAGVRSWVAQSGGGTSVHSSLSNLDYASAGHTGFAKSAGDVSQAFSASTLTLEGGTYDWSLSNTSGVLNISQYTTTFAFSNSGLFTTASLNISSGTASTIASFDSSRNIVSLATSTYPSLTELSYLKGVTSSVQTQITARALLAGSTSQAFSASEFHLPTGTTGTDWLLKNNSGTFQLITWNGAASSNFLSIDASKNITTYGTITASSTITASNFILGSDIRLKHNITTINNISKLDNLNLKQFTMIADKTNRLRYGVIAQELELLAPEFVYTNEDGIKSVGYTDLLIAKIARLEERLKLLENV